MGQKVATFEGEIKRARLSKLTRFATSLLGGLLILTFLLLYFMTGLSRSGRVRLEGNVNLQIGDINSIIHNDKKDFLLTYNTKKARELLTHYPLIEAAKVSIRPFSLDISISEITPLCLVDNAVYFSDGNDKLDVLDDFITRLIDDYAEELPVFYPRGLAEKYYGSYFAPLFSLDGRVKKMMTHFMPLKEVTSNMSYTYLFLFPSLKYEYYGLWLTIDDVAKVMTYSRVKECVDVLENDAKDYLARRDQVQIGTSTYHYLPIGYSATKDAFIQMSFGAEGEN